MIIYIYIYMYIHMVSAHFPGAGKGAHPPGAGMARALPAPELPLLAIPYIITIILAIHFSITIIIFFYGT